MQKRKDYVLERLLEKHCLLCEQENSVQTQEMTTAFQCMWVVLYENGIALVSMGVRSLESPSLRFASLDKLLRGFHRPQGSTGRDFKITFVDILRSQNFPWPPSHD